MKNISEGRSVPEFTSWDYIGWAILKYIFELEESLI